MPLSNVVDPLSVTELQEDNESVWLQAGSRQNPESNTTIATRTTRKCSFCRCEHHTIRNCDSPDRFLIIDNINLFIDVRNGHYLATTSDHYVEYELQSSLMNCEVSVLKMYCIILIIRARKYKYEMVEDVSRKIMKMRKIRKEAFLAEENERETRLYKCRFLEIMNIHRQILTLENETVAEENSNELETLKQTLNQTLFGKINQFRAYYDHQPALYLILRDRMLDEENRLRNKIPVKTIYSVEEKQKQEQKECPICYETVPVEKSLLTQCSHTFCIGCITKNVRTDKERKCPCCRSKIVEFTNYCTSDSSDKISFIYCSENA